MKYTDKLFELSEYARQVIAARAPSTAFRLQSDFNASDGLRVQLMLPWNNAWVSHGSLTVSPRPTDGKVTLKIFIECTVCGEFVQMKTRLWGLQALQRLASAFEERLGPEAFDP